MGEKGMAMLLSITFAKGKYEVYELRWQIHRNAEDMAKYNTELSQKT